MTNNSFVVYEFFCVCVIQNEIVTANNKKQNDKIFPLDGATVRPFVAFLEVILLFVKCIEQ